MTTVPRGPFSGSLQGPKVPSAPRPSVLPGRVLPTVAGTCLVSAFPLASGHGQVAQNMFDLGLFERMVMFRIRRQDSEVGYQAVIRPRLPVNYASAFLSLYLPGRWSRAVERSKWVHYASPHFFHLSKYNPRSSGTVHDLIFLDPRTHNVHDTPPGARQFFPRVLKYVEQLAGVVVVSRATESAVKVRYPRARTTVIHSWTRDDFQIRNREEARRILGLPQDRTLLLHVSIDNQRKNLEILPRVLERLDPSILLVRIGDCARIRSQFAPGRLLERPFVAPSEYPLYFNAADALLIPSWDEGFGVPIIEAVNSGLPVVASDIEIFREVLGASHPFFARPDDPARWSELARTAVEVGRSDPGCSRLYAHLGRYYRAPRAAEEFRRFYAGLGVAPPATGPSAGAGALGTP